MTARARVVGVWAAHVGIVGFFFLAVGALRADQQPRTTGAAVPGTGTGRIAGIVVDAQGRPVRSAIVMLTGAELPTGRAAITDDAGRFSFERLPAGRFSLSSSKPAYLKATYGAIRPGGAGTPITLGASDELMDLRLMMPRGGVIAGTVRDEKGTPLPGVQVSAARPGAPANPLLRADGVYTDDRGAFRIFGLAPGTYYVMAASLSSGGLGEIGVMSAAQIDATFARLKQRAVPAALTTQKPAPENSPSSIVRPTETYSRTPVFAPGVHSPGASTPLVLGLGEERTGIDIVFRLARAAAVHGTVTGSAPGDFVQISLLAEGVTVQMPTMLGAGPMLQRRSANGDGEFAFTNVTPGKYTLLARTTVSPGSGRAGGPLPALAASAPSALFATATLDARGEDITGLALILQPALHVTGRLTAQSTASTSPPDLTKIRLYLATAGPSAVGVSSAGVPVSTVPTGGFVRTDGSFDVAGVIPGSYRLSSAGVPAGWWLRSAKLGDLDLLDVLVEIGSSDLSGVVVTLTDQHSELTGRLLQPNGTPATGYFVIAFSADRAHWRPQARRLRSVRTSTDGQFRIEDLPAGDYYLAALTDADSDEWQSADFLTQVVSSAIKVTIRDGEKTTQDMRVAGGGTLDEATRTLRYLSCSLTITRARTTLAPHAMTKDGTAVRTGQITSASSNRYRCWLVAPTDREWMFAPTASPKAPIATATATCRAANRGVFSSRTRSYVMWAAYPMALTAHAARRHARPWVAGSANTMPTRAYPMPRRTAVRTHD